MQGRMISLLRDVRTLQKVSGVSFGDLAIWTKCEPARSLGLDVRSRVARALGACLHSASL